MSSRPNTEQDPVHLDGFALPVGTWVAGKGPEAEALMMQVGLCGSLRDSMDAPLTLGSAGLQVQVWSVEVPADSRDLPQPLKTVIWGTGADVLHLCDAAALPGIDGPDALPGLEVFCLFDAPAAETLAAAAPYLVKLEPEHAQRAHLFDDSGTSRSHWPRAPGIFLHTKAPMADVRGALRRFTKLRDGDRWVYLRLADPRHMMPLLLGLSAGQRGRLFAGLDAMIAIEPEEGVLLRATCTDPVTQDAIQMTPWLRASLDASSVARFAGEAERFCRYTLVDRPALAAPRRFCRLAVASAQAANIHDREAVLFAIAAAWCADDPEWIGQQVDIVGNSTVTQIDKGPCAVARGL